MADAGLGADLAALVARRPAQLTEVTWLRPASSQRATVRLGFADGSLVKGRRLASAADAERLSALAERAPAGAIARVLDRQGAAVLEEWVAGGALDPAADPDLLARAGELLAAFAAVELPPAVGDWRMRRIRPDKLERSLAALVAASVISEPAAEQLLARARHSAPALAEAGLVHLDFAPENLVELASGKLCSIDNESLSVGAHDQDLARALQRWPMSAAGRTAFLDGYRRRRSPAAFLDHEAYWTILGLAGSLRFALRERPEWVEELRQRLLDRAPARAAPAPPSPEAHLGLGKTTIRVRAPRADLEWLVEMVSPWLAGGGGVAGGGGGGGGGGGAPKWTIEAGAPRPERRRPGPAGRAIPTFTLDGPGGALLARSFWSGAGTLDDPESGMRLHLAPPTVYLETSTQSGLRMGLLRLVRELALAPAIGGGGVLLHASAFAHLGLGVLALGPKRSGKTSLLLHALAEGAGYLANDRVLLAGSDIHRFHGVPTVVSIRADTPATLPALAALPLWYKWTHAECAARSPADRRGVVSPAALELSPAQVCSAFAVAPLAETEVGALLFPSIEAGARGLELRPLAAAGARARLADCVLAPAGIPEAFALHGGATRPDLVEWRAAILARVAAQVPAFTVALGPDAWAAPGAVSALVARLRRG